MTALYARYLVLIFACCSWSLARAEEAVSEKKPPVKVEIAEGALVLPAPSGWKKVTPRNRIIELEFSVAGKDSDHDPARFTVMASGGTLKQNVDRWIGQFRNHKKPEQGEIGEVEEMEVDGLKAHLVDLTGDYLDSPRGPFGPKVQRDGYRMLAGILETKGSGTYFFKLVGPEQVVSENADAFREMIAGVKRK